MLIAGLVALVQGTSYLIVSHVHQENAKRSIEAKLVDSAEEFDQRIAERLDDYTARAQLMQGDYALRQVLLSAPNHATLNSALDSYLYRFKASSLVLLDADHKPLASSGLSMNPRDWEPFQLLVAKAETDDSPNPRAIGYALLGGRLHALLVVPVFAPRPQIAAWLGISLEINAAMVARLRRTDGPELSFISAPPRPALLASTLGPTRAAPLLAHPPENGLTLDREPDDTLLLYAKPVRLVGGGTVRLVLERSLDAELAPVRGVERLLLYGAIASLVAALLLAQALARTVSQPVQQLAEHTRRIAQGDYDTRITLPGSDEFSDLAKAFNAMSQGLAERDRVRDLLDKNVSPEIAARLLHEGDALGGEEREVTVVFVDIRRFTARAETLPPRQLLALLNRFFDRMSQEIEREGGVVDKYIGDAVMALFGAPLAQDDSAGRALRTALSMRRALAELNSELAREGVPLLEFGIGINTTRVVTGNIGSSRRRNYSVIGDGVNVAARLQAETRNPAHQADIIVSAATLEAASAPPPSSPLGPIAIKGRSGSINAYALL